MTTLPTVFVSHGSPMLALDAGRTGEAWRTLAAGLPRPRAVLMVSAHWGSLAPKLNTTARPETIHDFGGFTEPLYQVQYPAPGAPWLAERGAELLAAAGLPATLDAQRGIDHGAWVPLKLMYPDADVPVAQLSLQPRQGPAHHYQLGRALQSLRDEGVLIVGSGSLTHNLYEVYFGVEDGPRIPAYVPAFQQWMHEHLLADEVEQLLHYRELAPAAARAHPTEEHLLPIYVALGAAGEHPAVARRYAGITEGVLAMDIYTFGG